MVADNKKRHVVSYEKLSPELLEAFKEKYPGGLNETLDDLVKYPKPDGTSFYAVTIETVDSINLVKIPVRVDDVEDVEKWLEGEEAAEVEQVAGTTDEPDTSEPTLPDDNISQYGGDDDSAEA